MSNASARRSKSDVKPVLFYERYFYCFSNFSAFAVMWRGAVWPTVEHAYQAAKFHDWSIQERIRAAPSAHEAKKIARSLYHLKLSDWEHMKLPIMEDILLSKLEQHEFVRERLIESGDRLIVEDSPKDSFWGWGPNKKGKNHLGRIWMKLRSEVRKGRI